MAIQKLAAMRLMADTDMFRLVNQIGYNIPFLCLEKCVHLKEFSSNLNLNTFSVLKVWFLFRGSSYDIGAQKIVCSGVMLYTGLVITALIIKGIVKGRTNYSQNFRVCTNTRNLKKDFYVFHFKLENKNRELKKKTFPK